MPFLSSKSSRKEPSQPPCLQFQGPDNQGRAKAFDVYNREVACFTIAGDSIRRDLPTQQHLCTMQRSFFSGTTRINIHEQTIEVKQSWEGMQYGKDVLTSFGTLRWRPGSGGHEELRDGQQKLLARGRLAGMFRKKPSKVEVFVSGDEFLLDLILASWICIVRE